MRASHAALTARTRSMMSDFDVKLVDENPADVFVIFHGPKDSPYENGSWKVHVELPDGYPYKSPSIGFCNRMYHPNVDEMSGTVCLDVINQTWSPMFDLINVFEVFLPQVCAQPLARSPPGPHPPRRRARRPMTRAAAPRA